MQPLQTLVSCIYWHPMTSQVAHPCDVICHNSDPPLLTYGAVYDVASVDYLALHAGTAAEKWGELNAARHVIYRVLDPRLLI